MGAEHLHDDSSQTFLDPWERQVISDLISNYMLEEDAVEKKKLKESIYMLFFLVVGTSMPATCAAVSLFAHLFR